MLSDEQIVDAALALIKRDGADRFSMRQLAKELGVTPMSIYYYVGNKDALFERLGDAVLARLPRAQPTGVNWRAELKAGAIQGFRALSEYPGLMGQIIKRPPTHQSKELAQHGISILVAAGFEPEHATRITTVCQAFMFGMIGLQAQLERAQRKKPKSRPSGSRPEVHELVEFGLDAVLNGVAEPQARGQRSKAARPVGASRRGVVRAAVIKA